MEKKRCNNFTANEIDVLVSLVEKFKEIVECKKTDTITNNGKEAEWRKIEMQFNSICGTGRTAKMLRSKWDSLKKSIKKEYADYKQQLYKTGGGPKRDLGLNNASNRIVAIIGVGATGTISQFDSDFGMQNMLHYFLFCRYKY
ncbi:myb/SANT-like DNA-binding domain-containing protein 3 [Diabrotica undecimpunctata]|uniref:myb/SANT-like DNA-binding domain-containing protein 3 n=1 Tax=Diabrotica undecimpunctata TaxID=50387 RepID=UPI003B6383A8